MADVAETTPAPASSSASQLADAIFRIRIAGGRLQFTERTLMLAGGVLAGVGCLLVLLGWIGAARTPYLPEQIPYLISGGLFGLALVFLGGFLYFAYWLTESVREQRAQTAALLDALAQLAPPSGENGDTAATATAAAPAPGAGTGLVATPKGTMAHRPDCAVVAGKRGLRKVKPSDKLEPCKLCDPYGEAA